MFEKTFGNRFGTALNRARQITTNWRAIERKDRHTKAPRANVVFTRGRNHVNRGRKGVVGKTKAASGNQITMGRPIFAGKGRRESLEAFPTRSVSLGRLGELSGATAGLGDGDRAGGSFPLFIAATALCWGRVCSPWFFEHLGD